MHHHLVSGCHLLDQVVQDLGILQRADLVVDRALDVPGLELLQRKGSPLVSHARPHHRQGDMERGEDAQDQHVTDQNANVSC